MKPFALAVVFLAGCNAEIEVADGGIPQGASSSSQGGSNGAATGSTTAAQSVFTSSGTGSASGSSGTGSAPSTSGTTSGGSPDAGAPAVTLHWTFNGGERCGVAGVQTVEVDFGQVSLTFPCLDWASGLGELLPARG